MSLFYHFLFVQASLGKHFKASSYVCVIHNLDLLAFSSSGNSMFNSSRTRDLSLRT